MCFYIYALEKKLVKNAIMILVLAVLFSGCSAVEQ